MGFLSGVANVIGDGWNDLFGSDDAQKKKQQQQQLALQKAQTSKPTTNTDPTTSPSLNLPQPPQPNINNLNLTPLQKASPVLPQPDASTLVKAPQQPQITTAPAAPPDNRSFIQKVTHNPVTNVVGGALKFIPKFAEDWSNTFANLGNKAAGRPDQTIQQNMGGDPLLDNTLKMSGATGTNKELAGGAAQVALAAGAPGVDSLIKAGVTKATDFLAPKVTQGGIDLLNKYVSHGVTGATVTPAFSAADQAGSGVPTKEIINKVPEEAGLGFLLGSAVPLAGDLKKFAVNRNGLPTYTGTGAETGADAGVAPIVNEVAPGIKSANPNQAADAIKQAAEATPPATPVETPTEAPVIPRATPEAPSGAMFPGRPTVPEGTPPPVLTPDTTPVAPTETPNLTPVPNDMPVTPDVMHPNELDNLSNLDKASQTRVLTAEEKATQAALQAKKDGIIAANKTVEPVVTPASTAEAAQAVAEGKPVTPAPLDANGNPILQSADAEAKAAENAGVSPNQVPVAPRTRDALVKALGDGAKTLSGDTKMRDTVNLDDLKQKAAGIVANMSDEDVLSTFASNKVDSIPNDVNGLSVIRAALDRLIKMDPANPDVASAVENAMDAIAERSSKSGLIQRFVQEDFDTMPLPMKVRYIVNQIDKANKDVEGYQRIGDDPAVAVRVNQAITDYLNSGEVISQRIAELQGKLDAIAEQSKQGIKTDVNVKDLAKSLADEKRQLSANNGELVNYYQKLIPDISRGQKVNDFARSMMLGSFSGRINDFTTTANNIAHLGLQNMTQGLLAKVVNKFSPGAALDTLRGHGAFATGTGSGLKEGTAQLGGTRYAGDLQKSLKSSVGSRTDMSQPSGRIGRFIQSATDFTTKASEGVRNQRLYQLAYQEGQKNGIPKDMLNQYAETVAANPSHIVAEKADILWKQMNNLNSNPISDALRKVSNAIGETHASPGDTVAVKSGKFIAGAIKNQILPFTSWLGGNMWNSLTDKNVIASLAKTLVSAKRGDVNGLVENIAKTANNAAATYALGYLMTQHGLIVNKNPEGYNDAGAYLHIGGRYIPVNYLGFFAPSIILGNATYQGFNNKDNTDVVSKFGDTLSKTITNELISTGANALGASNNFIKSVTTATKADGAGPAIAQFAGGAAGEFIPAVTGDVNSILNNGLQVPGTNIGIPAYNNPNHEAANTTVQKINPATGLMKKDVPASILTSLENRIPGMSQSLPRKAGVAAPDFIDRVTKGDRDTSTSIKALNDAKTQADQSTYDKVNDIPDIHGVYPGKATFETAVEARIQNGEYDKAKQALQQQLDSYKGNKDIAKSTSTDLENKIKTLQVLQDGKYDPGIRDLYKNTSLSEWRNMGDPKSDTYDQKTYDLLWQYDGALAKAGVSKSSLSPKDSAFTVAKPSKGSSGAGGNTIGSLPTLNAITLGNLSPEKITSTKIPTIQQINAGDLIKKRTISVSKGR